MIINSINPRTMTKFIKKDQITSSWYEIDAKNAVVGRLATVVSKIKLLEEKIKLLTHHIWIMEILLLLKILNI